MSLDISKLEAVRQLADKITARCPACAETGSDKVGDHLCVYPDGRFGCVLFPSETGKEHRKRILQLAGGTSQELPRLPVRLRVKEWESLSEAAKAISLRLNMPETRRDIYRDSCGAESFAVFRFDAEDRKKYRPVHFTGTGWRDGDPEGLLPLFRLDALTARNTKRVFVVEGEKCACVLEEIGLLATTSAHGAKAARKSDWKPLAGRLVALLPDNDDAGREYVRNVAAQLSELCPPAEVKIVELPGLPLAGDVADWCANDTRLPNGKAAAIEEFARGAVIHPMPNPESNTAAEPVSENDTGNARLFVDRFGTDIRFVPILDVWLIWDGSRWVRDQTGGIQRMGMQLSQALLRDAVHIPDHNQSRDAASRAIRLGNAKKISSMLELAQCDRTIIKSHSELDRDPWLLGVVNGVVDLRTGTFRNGSRADLITKVGGCAYNSAASAPRWIRFLEEIFANDQELVVFVQKWVGYTLTGSTSDQSFLFLYGSGANGKTTFIETIFALLGNYAQRAPASLLVSSDNGREPSNEIARLQGARLIVGSEARDGDRLAENRIKDMTGGDTLTGRFLYHDFFDFVPVLKLWMFGNHLPEIRGTDHGIWRRVRLIPFNVAVDEAKRDQSLSAKLRDELPGILNWAIQGCLLWQRDGLKQPVAVAKATAGYREEEDILGDFLAAATEKESDLSSPHSDVYKAYTDWCAQSGIRFPMTSRKLSQRLSGRGLRKERTNAGIRWVGINLR